MLGLKLMYYPFGFKTVNGYNTKDQGGVVLI